MGLVYNGDAPRGIDPERVDNLMLVGAADAYEATFIDITDRDMALGRATVLGDLDSFTDWLGADCMNVVLQPELDLSHRCLRMPGRLAEANVAQLLFALLTTEDAADALEVRRALVQRYLAENEERVMAAAARAAQGFAS